MEIAQFLNYIIITVYTHTSNPQIHMDLIDPKNLRLQINWVTQGIRFHGPVDWPGNITISTNGTVKIVFNKATAGNWNYTYMPINDNIGIPLRIPKTYKYKVLENRVMKTNTFILTITPMKNVYNHIYPGQWVSVVLKMFVRGIESVKARPFYVMPYIPINTLYDPNPAITYRKPTINNICIMINKGKSIETVNYKLYSTIKNDEIFVTSPDGGFNMELINNRTRVYFFLGATGAIPMASVILSLLQQTNTTKVHIILCSRDESTLYLVNYFKKLVSLDNRVVFETLVAMPWHDYIGHYGYVSIGFYKAIGVPIFYTVMNSIYIVVSGNPVFVNKVSEDLKINFAYPDESINKFTLVNGYTI